MDEAQVYVGVHTANQWKKYFVTKTTEQMDTRHSKLDCKYNSIRINK
jgi:hypothetical protein